MQRDLNLLELLKKKSCFLFGPRATGKTYLIREQLSEHALIIDLLKSSTALPLRNNPSELSALVAASDKSFVVIDEIQKIPELLDEVHHLIETRHCHFLLTGSSARKLKRGNANLLGGRASTLIILPLTWSELTRAKIFNLERYLRYGGLPRVYLGNQAPQEELHDYVETYLREEIQAESLVRNLPNFSRFLKVAAMNNGLLTNYTKLASDVGLSATTVKEYFQILDDTLIGFTLPPWQESKKRKAITTAKHYIFDTGVCHTLAGTMHLDRNSNLYGISFELFILNEIRAYISYRRIYKDLFFWRTKHQDEVDIVIGDHTAIEIKSASKVSERDIKSLRLIAEENKWQNLFLISNDETPKKYDDHIFCWHWSMFLEKLWDGSLI